MGQETSLVMFSRDAQRSAPFRVAAKQGLVPLLQIVPQMPGELRRDLLGGLLVLGEREDDADGRLAGRSAASQRGFAPVFAERHEVAGGDAFLAAVDGPFAAERHLAAALLVVSVHERFAVDRPDDLFGVSLLALEGEFEL